MRWRVGKETGLKRTPACVCVCLHARLCVCVCLRVQGGLSLRLSPTCFAWCGSGRRGVSQGNETQRVYWRGVCVCVYARVCDFVRAVVPPIKKKKTT